MGLSFGLSLDHFDSFRLSRGCLSCFCTGSESLAHLLANDLDLALGLGLESFLGDLGAGLELSFAIGCVLVSMCFGCGLVSICFGCGLESFCFGVALKFSFSLGAGSAGSSTEAHLLAKGLDFGWCVSPDIVSGGPGERGEECGGLGVDNGALVAVAR